MIREYYLLTKPGIIRGNILTLIAGFMVGTMHHGFSLPTLLWALIGTSLVVASSCVLNNIFDRDIDKYMARTKTRALVMSRISVRNAVYYAITLGVIGFVVLLIKVNALTALLGLLGMVLYVIVYTFMKRQTSYGTIIGSLSGSVPPLAGYSAAANVIDLTSITLFLSMTCWQMSHFYAIALYRMNEYKKAKIPLLPIVKGVSRTKVSVISYVFGFALTCSTLYLLGAISEISFLIFVILSTAWICLGVYFYRDENEIKWGKNMFLFSLIVISAWCLILSIDSLS